MAEPLERLLEAHVQHELASFRGDALRVTVEERVRALFDWFAEVKLDDVCTRAQIAGVVDRYVIDLRVSGGITELSGEMSRLVFTSQATAQTRLDSIFSHEMYREFADKLLALDGVRRELIALIAHSATVRSIRASLIARAVLDLIGVVPPSVGLLPPVLSSLSTRASAALLRAVEYVADRALAQHRERLEQRGDERLVEQFGPERLRALLDDLWEHVSMMRLSEVFAFLHEQDIEDFVVLIYEFWLRYRKTDFFRRVAEEAIDHFFQKYGQATLSAVIDDMGVDERMVTSEVLMLVGPMLDHAARSGALERGIRRRLEAFYRSSAAREVVGG